jgi:prepilin-type N-terminal cleavage/methylation domain-containing protein
MIERYREIKRQKAAGEREEGFTLIELLIVIVVLGILAAVVVFALGGVTGSSAQSACSADAKTVETAVAAFQADNPGVTPTAGNSGNLVATPTTLTGGPFLRSWPSNSGHYFIGLEDTYGSTNVGEVDVDPSPGTLTTAPAANTSATSGPWVNFDTETGSTGCNAVK